MELEIERKLQETRYENRKSMVQMISAVAAVAEVGGFGVAIGWCAGGGSARRH
jgi:hypothetical protein